MEIDPFIEAATSLFENIGADAILVEVDSNKDMEKIQEFISSKKINLFGVSSNEKIKKKFDKIIYVPGILKKITTRLEFAISAALMQELLKNEDKIIYVGRIDSESHNFIVTRRTNQVNAKGIYELFFSLKNVKTEVIYSVLSIAVQLGRKGKEGKPIGTSFIIGDCGNVMQKSSQITYNPFERSYVTINDQGVQNMIKEFSRLDGAFIISGDGKLLAASRYLEAGKDGISLPKGLGARHLSAAWMTKVTDAVAIVLAESDNMIRIFKNGELVWEVDPDEVRVD
ncbi:MAG: DisA bacterial checkpoint controller nucleotide-binding protein [Candidatus Methanofastidiosum methylothiophilum]|uniref:Diadenylate cyclase n=1 Tax=Candidatus Methanofastidiosum methylothiophilum TaxID=1705564 RepID=A0A150J9Y6_9EURY|nr:MAG: DisA bacterial checkpoint controller nucleotide-binding protein [Candidatus Methanofastidiosum methylthiophilus]NMC76769.1 diadenylate cyclase [Candidatus Methanofastidiosa archaeon]